MKSRAEIEAALLLMGFEYTRKTGRTGVWYTNHSTHVQVFVFTDLGIVDVGVEDRHMFQEFTTIVWEQGQNIIEPLATEVEKWTQKSLSQPS